MQANNFVNQNEDEKDEDSIDSLEENKETNDDKKEDVIEFFQLKTAILDDKSDNGSVAESIKPRFNKKDQK